MQGPTEDEMKEIEKKKRILVVDDERLIADSLAQIFSMNGYDAQSVYSAEEALKLFEAGEWVPDLAVVDVHLPGMNGLDLTIRLQAEYPGCKVSLFSGQTATSTLLEMAAESGHNFDVMAKPVHPTVMLATAEKLLMN